MGKLSHQYNCKTFIIEIGRRAPRTGLGALQEVSEDVSRWYPGPQEPWSGLERTSDPGASESTHPKANE